MLEVIAIAAAMSGGTTTQVSTPQQEFTSTSTFRVIEENALQAASEAHQKHVEHVEHMNRLAALRAAQKAEHTYAPRHAKPAPAYTSPSSTATVAPVGGSFEVCVIARESGGNPNAWNGDHWGLFQMTPDLWSLGGGSPSSYGSASAGEQEVVFNTIMAGDINGGANNWAPYDGC